MVQFVRIFYIGAVISALSLVPITGMAQDKKVIPPKEKVTESKEKSTVTKPGNSVTNKDQGVIQVREGADGKFRFTIRTYEDKYIAGSAAFATKGEAIKAIADLKSFLGDAKVVHLPKIEPKADSGKGPVKK